KAGETDHEQGQRGQGGQISQGQGQERTAAEQAAEGVGEAARAPGQGGQTEVTQGGRAVRAVHTCFLARSGGGPAPRGVQQPETGHTGGDCGWPLPHRDGHRFLTDGKERGGQVEEEQGAQSKDQQAASPGSHSKAPSWASRGGTGTSPRSLLV